MRIQQVFCLYLVGVNFCTLCSNGGMVEVGTG